MRFGTYSQNTSLLFSLKSGSTFRQTLKDLTILSSVSELELTRANDQNYLWHPPVKIENFSTFDSSVILHFINYPESVLQKNHQVQALLKSGEAYCNKDRVVWFESP